MTSFLVGGKVVDKVDLLRRKHWSWRFDVWPFAIIYAIWLIVVVPSIDIVDATIVFGGLLALHILVWLFTVWSVDFRCFVQYSKVCIFGIIISQLRLLKRICLYTMQNCACTLQSC